MAVEAQARAGAASGSGRSSLDGVTTSMDGSMLSDGSYFDADGRCHSPGTLRAHAGGGVDVCGRSSADMEIDSSCGQGDRALEETRALGNPSDSDAQALARTGGGSLRIGGGAGSLRSMCTDLHDMGTLLGAPSESHGDSDEARAQHPVDARLVTGGLHSSSL